MVTTSKRTFPRENPMSHTSFTSWPTLALVQDVQCVQAILAHILQAPDHFVTLCSRPQTHLHCLGLVYLRKEERKISRMNSTPQFFLQRSCALKSDHQECAPPCFVTPGTTLTGQKEQTKRASFDFNHPPLDLLEQTLAGSSSKLDVNLVSMKMEANSWLKCWYITDLKMTKWSHSEDAIRTA